MSLAQRLARIQEQIAASCRRAGRAEREIALMAVSKTHPAEAVAEAYAAGVRLFGENRVQEWQEKRTSLQHLFSATLTESSIPDFSIQASQATRSESLVAQAHLIGPLQSNKTVRAAEIFDAIDAVDSLKIAARLDAAARTLGKRLPILIEVKLSHEASKHGIAPAELPALLTSLVSFDSLIPSGLMTVPPWDADYESARIYFRQLRQLRDASLPVCPTLTQLSMGMSSDYAVAIEEGSTCIRIGSALFGKRPPLAVPLQPTRRSSSSSSSISPSESAR
jgi:pyridoxal phosphate enzyme (YggS family)